MFVDDALRIAATSYKNEPGYQDPYDDLSNYGIGKSYVRYDRRNSRQTFSNNWRAMKASPGNGAFFGGVPQIAFSSNRVQRGEVLPTLIDNSVGIASYPFLESAFTPLLRLAAPLGLTAAAPLAATISSVFVAYGLGKAAAGATRYFQDFGYRLRHIEQGGNYHDTETAQAFRLMAVGEMSSALSYSRRWLGNEAQFMRSQ